MLLTLFELKAAYTSRVLSTADGEHMQVSVTPVTNYCTCHTTLQSATYERTAYMENIRNSQ